MKHINQNNQTFTNLSFNNIRFEEKTIVIDDVAESVVLAKNYPWVDGVQDTSAEITNYQTTIFVKNLYGSRLPKAGDTIHLVWNGVSDKDISKLYVYLVDNSEAVDGWRWLWLCDKEVLKENIKAGEPFNIVFKA